MKRILFLLALVCLEKGLHAQYVYTIKADSVKITNTCDTAELIIENHSQTVPGFLFNKGRGRTEFRKPFTKVDDSIYVIGVDTLRLSSAWLQGGNRFGTTGKFGTLDNNHIDFYTNNTQQLRLTNTGNLLVGTNIDDGYKLQIKGNVSLTNLEMADVRSPRFQVLIGDESVAGGTGFLFYGDATARPIVIGGGHSNNLRKFHFQTGGQAGDTIATYNLSYNSNMAHALNIYNAAEAQTKLLLTAPGNLLVGTTYDDGSRLQLVNNGAISIDPTLSRSGDKIVFGGRLGTYDGQNVIIRTSNDNGGTYKNILVERDGNIGLGTSNVPYGWVVGNPSLRVLAEGSTQIMAKTHYFGNTGGPANSSALITSISNINEWQQGFGNYPNRENYYYFGTILQGTGTSGNVRAPLYIGARELRFNTGSADTTAMVITENRSMLLGTVTDNGNKLQVTGNCYFNGAQQVTGTVRFSGLTNDNSLTHLVVSDAGGNLYYREAASLALNETINSDLAVKGTVTAQKMLISQTGRWPDYVFSKQYQLPSLMEVENYINQNSHLPGIPAAAEVEKKGIDVAGNQAALLKKIEELTLYIIEQEKTIQKQNDQIKDLLSLKQEMAELKALIKNNNQPVK